MDLRELENYRLSDAVKFNQQLNPRLWGSNEHLLPEVRERLLAMADDFREFLGVNDLEIQDITISGSNAAYTYTPHSDIDLHLVVDMASVCDNDVMRELFDAKKYQYNDEHNYKIGGYDVELYVQDAAQPHHSQGIYSLINNDWVRVPERRQPRVDDMSVQSKYQDLASRVDAAIESGDLAKMDALAKKIRAMRQAGLDQHGEFGAENLAFKVMRGNGTLQRLRDARLAAKDRDMSLDEAGRRGKRKSWGKFGGMWFPGYGYYTSTTAENPEAADDGVNESAHMPVRDLKSTLEIFARSCINYLGIKNPPRIVLKRDPEWTRRNGTFGRYDPETNSLYLATNNRHTLDILRTMAHEFTHARQNEVTEFPVDAGETGSPYEDEANAMAGRIMRHWADEHPEYFDGIPLEEAPVDEGWREKAAGVAAAACIAGTPGCATTGSTATDVLSGVRAVGTAAQTVKQTGTAGARELVIQRAKDELRRQRGEVVPEDYDPDHPPGPETPPTMPAGTVRVDVSDVYDWYKLGQHISNMKGLGHHDFGQGPPSTILSFGDEDTEHKYIQDLKRTGLDTTDIDPRDPNQPPGMPRQKTDPTYNVNEQSGKKSAIYSTDVYGMTAYHSKCLEPGCDWESRRYDSIKLAQNAAQKHAQKHFKQGVAEAFDQPYKLKWEKSQYGDYDALAKLDDGTYLSIMFNNEYKKNWMVEFYRNNSQEVTGEGDAQRIFATVLTAIRQFIQKKKPQSLFFSAVKEDDPTGSRTKLYDRLVQRYAGNLGYSIQRQEHPGQMAYKLIRTAPVTEASGYIPVNDKEARDPRYSMALTVDIRPGETQRQAAKMGWKTDRAGRPPLLMKSLENRLQESLNAMKVKDIVKEATLGGFKVKPLKIGQQQVDELKLDAPQRRMSRDELQAYADRIKTGTKTKQDKFSPIIHGSNIKAIVRDNGGTEWDLDDLAQQITTRPRQILGTNAKMEKSKGEGEIVYDLTLPALSGIVVDEDNGDFVEITTCPGAGQCQLFCYARKGGYVMFPASSMSAAQALNFLVNDPQGYMDTVNREITTIKNRAAKNGIKLVVRWHDAGDFFSKEYLDLAFDIARAHPDVEFYAYTKIANVATADKPSNFLINFSSGSKRGEEKKIELYKSQGNVPKEGVTVPKDMFFDLIAREGNKLIKDAKGRTQFKSAEALETFKQRLAQQYKINPNTIITYDEMLATPAGDKPQWNVIVQPGAGDRAANRRDVINSFLMFH